MKKAILVIFLLVSCPAVFAKPHKQHKTRKPVNGIISVTMHRTPCYGRCPDYTIELNKDGSVIYTGIRFTADSGAFTKYIGAKAGEIINMLSADRVDTCKNRYMNRMQDMPGVNFTIRYKDSSKYIQNAQFGPAYLRLLATTMDSEGKKTDSIGWKKTAGPGVK
jgi:hypothetical protein